LRYNAGMLSMRNRILADNVIARSLVHCNLVFSLAYS
jgi:hypothetical protein